MSAPSPAAALLDTNLDLFADQPEQPEAPALEIVPRRTLRGHVATVEFIADSIEALDDDSLTPERRDELSAALIAELAGTRAKVDRVASVLAMFEHLAQAAGAEAKRLEKRAEYFSRQAARLTDYVLAVLEASQLKKLEGETSTLARRLSPPAVLIDDENLIPREFMRHAPQPPPPPAVPDKVRIAGALKAKRDVPGARLVQRARLVRS
jgi:hypothetical protein